MAQLAAAVGLSPTPCWCRIKAMDASGVVRSDSVLIVRCLSTTGQRDDVRTVLAPATQRCEALLHQVLFKLPG